MQLCALVTHCDPAVTSQLYTVYYFYFLYSLYFTYSLYSLYSHYFTYSLSSPYSPFSLFSVCSHPSLWLPILLHFSQSFSSPTHIFLPLPSHILLLSIVLLPEMEKGMILTAKPSVDQQDLCSEIPSHII